jgi:hypothetical protein
MLHSDGDKPIEQYVSILDGRPLLAESCLSPGFGFNNWY